MITTTVAEHHQNGGDSNGTAPYTNGTAGQTGAIERCTYSGCTYGHAEYDQSSPSPMKWDFIASGDGDPNKNQSAYHQTHAVPETTSSSSESQYTQQYRGTATDGSNGKPVSIWQTAGGGGGGTTAAETNAIIYHHESGMVENCCENYAFSGDYGGADEAAGDGSDGFGDAEASEVSEAELSAFFDKHMQRQLQQQQLLLSAQPPVQPSAPKLNNTTTPGTGNGSRSGAAIAHSGTAAGAGAADIVLSRRNNIAAAINRLNLSPDFRHYEKITNLSQQQACNLTPNRFPSIGAGGLNVYNANYCYNEVAAAVRADKFATAEATAAAAAAAAATAPDTFELFNISGGGGGGGAAATEPTAAAGQRAADGRTAAGISLTTQNVFETSVAVQPATATAAARRFGAVDATSEQPPTADLLFYDLGDEHTLAAQWATTGASSATAAGEIDDDGLPLQQRQRRRFQADGTVDDVDNGGVGGGSSEVSAFDAIVMGGGGDGSGGQRGGLRGLFRNVRRRARQYKEFMQGDR